MSPSAHSSSHRYPTSVDPRYYPSPSTVASSSPLSDPAYPPQNAYYAGQYGTRTHPSNQATSSQFIPTPSEIAHPYPGYPRQVPVSGVPQTSPDVYPSPEYPPPPHMVPSSQQSPHRPSRISTNRARSIPAPGHSPTSASSPPGERFPCERCGKTFSRSHDRKRHHETQHLSSPVIHRCRFCEKEFSRSVPFHGDIRHDLVVQLFLFYWQSRFSEATPRQWV